MVPTSYVGVYLFSISCGEIGVHWFQCHDFPSNFLISDRKDMLESY